VTGHLDETTWERLALRELDPAARATAIDHVTRCARCAKIWKGLHALEHAARAFDPGVPGATRGPSAASPTRARWRWLAAGGALAAAAVLVIVFVVAPRQDGPAAPVLRGPSDTLELISPAGETALPVWFRWQAVGGADRYLLELFSESGDRVWAATTDRSPFEVPRATDLSQARFARVTALAAGRELASSRLVSISIR